MAFFEQFPGITHIGIGKIADRPATAETDQHGYWAYDEVDGDSIGVFYIADPITLDWKKASGSDDKKFKVSTDDTTPGFAEDKLVEGPGVAIDVINPGANEQMVFYVPDESITEDMLDPDVVAQLGGGMQLYTINFSDATSSPLSMLTPPANAEIARIIVELPTEAASSGASIKIGTVADDDMYMEDTMVDMTLEVATIIECMVNAGATPDPMLLTIVTGGQTFSGTINIFYVVAA